MNLSQASELAVEVAAHARFLVIAVGRFRLLEELLTADADTLPWGVSVALRDNPQDRDILWSPEQWTALCKATEPKPVKRSKSKPATQPLASVPASATEDQLLLF